MRIRSFIAILLISISVFSCKKLETKRVSAITTNDITLSETNVNASGTLVDMGNKSITDHGFCWSINQEPTNSDNTISLGAISETGDFTSALANLQANATYYVRAYVAEENTIKYGNAISFIAPTTGINITTSEPIIISKTAATVSGSISNIGSLTILDYGHCWSTSNPPNINNSTSFNGNLNSDKTFFSTMDNLAISTTYFVRSYAKLNNSTVLYGNVQSVLIPDLTVTTDTYTTISSTSVSLQGSIISLGVVPLTNHGFCWSSVTSNPNINNNKIPLGATNNIGSFYTSLNSLQVGTTYYFRAYATDGNFVKYGIVKKIVL